MMLWGLALVTACDPGPEPQALTILAAASLAEAYDALEESFEAEHPGVDVDIQNF